MAKNQNGQLVLNLTTDF